MWVGGGWFGGWGAGGVFDAVSDGDGVSGLEWFVAYGAFGGVFYFWFHRFSSHWISSHFSVSACGLLSHICVFQIMSSLADHLVSVCLLLIGCVSLHAFSSSLIVHCFRSIVVVSIG